jgi:hypothetical protein
MILRYRCPLSYKHVEDIPLWKTATTAFMECIKNGIGIVESLEKGNMSSCKQVGVEKELPVLIIIIQMSLICNSLRFGKSLL